MLYKPASHHGDVRGRATEGRHKEPGEHHLQLTNPAALVTGAYVFSQLAQAMVETRISEGLFPSIYHVCQRVIDDSHCLTELLERTSRFRRELAEGVGFLGGQRR